jgi:hypothetical protein
VATPFYTTGFSGAGFPGFSDRLRQRGYSNEDNILAILPNLDTIQQIRLDMSLHQDAIGSDSFPFHRNLLYNDGKWKEQLISVFKGNNNPHLIKKLIWIIKRDIQSHQNRLSNHITGSAEWHKTWIEVYHQWLKKLKELYGQKNY